VKLPQDDALDPCEPIAHIGDLVFRTSRHRRRLSVTAGRGMGIDDPLWNGERPRSSTDLILQPVGDGGNGLAWPNRHHAPAQ
jgi:hypothetical protein